MKYTKENIERLARVVATNTDVDVLVDAMAEFLEKEYSIDERLFNEDAEMFCDD